jgi:phosphatidylglycerophosphate synthase
MTTAVLLATGAGTPAALLPLRSTGGTVIGRLSRQLWAAGVRDVVVLARPVLAGPLRAAGYMVRETPDAAADLATLAQLARDAAALVVAGADLIAHDSVIVKGLAGSALEAAALTTAPRSARLSAPVHVERGRVVSAGSTYHRVGQPDAAFAGLVWVGPDGLADGALAWDRAARVPAVRQTTEADALALALVALVRSGVTVAAPGTGGLYCGRVSDPAEVAAAETALHDIDEDAARLRASVKAEDDLFATFCVSSYSPRLARWAARAGLTPTMVTWLSVALAVIAAVLYAAGGRPGALIAALVLYASFVLDCVDGQLARYRQVSGRFGGWLDVLADRGKEYAVYAGLAIGAGHVWPLAVAALALQTVRHMTDAAYGAARDAAVARRARRRFDAFDGFDAFDAEPGAADMAAGGATSGVLTRLVEATNAGAGRRSLPYWAKRTIVMPIGERWMLIALGAALFNARVVFLALLGWGAVAALYTVGVRVLRSRALRVPGLGEVDVAEQRDDGWLARSLARRPGPSQHALPAALLALAAGVALLIVRAGPGAGRVPLAVAVVLAAALAARSGHQPLDKPLDWLVPGVLRAFEVTVVVALAEPARAPWALVFAELAVVALFWYDLSARLDRRASPLRGRAWALGWDGRLLVLAVAAAAGQLPLGLAALASYLAVLFVVGSLASLNASRRPAAGPVVGYRVPAPRTAVSSAAASPTEASSTDESPTG